MEQLYQSVRGMNDIYGVEAIKFLHIINSGFKIAHNYNFEYLNTPVVEYSSLFERNLGDTSDIISKELYRFDDKSGNVLALRPEFTASIVRCLIENKLLNSGGVKKYFSHGPLFRYDRPQQGRYRQFHQLNFEIVGTSTIGYDAECIMAGKNLLELIKPGKYLIEINYIGNYETRQKYKEVLIEYLEKYKTSLSPDSQKRLYSNPLRILDSKNTADKVIIKEGPLIQDCYSHEDLVLFNGLTSLMSSLGMEYNINPYLVRGLDYYDGLVFEIMQANNDLKRTNLTILGGGRYNGLIEKLSYGANSAGAIGFAVGFERLMMLLSLEEIKEDGNLIALIYYSANETSYAINIAERLRKIGLKVDIIHMEGNMRKKFQRADKIKARRVVICGEDEKAKNTIKIKDFISTKEIDDEIEINTFEIEDYFNNNLLKPNKSSA